MTPTVKNRLRNQVWSILPSYLDSFVESLDGAAGLQGLLERAPLQGFDRRGSIALIPIQGALGKRLDGFERNVLGMTDYDDIDAALTLAQVDDSVEKILLHIDSPGGSVTGLAELGRAVKQSQKPVFAYTDSLMASAAYHIGSQASAVYSSESAFVGSIGARVVHVEKSGMLDRIGITVSAFGKGKHKLDHSPFRPLSQDEAADLQAMVDEAHAEFRAVVESARSVDPIVFESKSYRGAQAVELGLTDGVLNSLSEALTFLG